MNLLLRFSRTLEAQFERDAGPMRCRRLVWRGIVALLVFDVFLFSDWQVTPDIFPIAAALRLGVVTPLAVVMLIVLWFEPPVWLRETMGAFSIVLAAATTLALMLLSHGPLREGQHHTIVLLVLFATVVQRIRFPYAAAGCLACLLLHAAALAAVPDYPHQLWISADMILAGAMVLSLIAAYSLERDNRLAYLNSQRERRISEELGSLSRLDPLTGLANRRSLDQILAALEARAGGTDELAMLLFDIDHFKLFNDSLGHQAGDVCPRRIAGILTAELRDEADTAFRFGGEEFLVVLPNTGLAAAVGIAERIRLAVEEAAIPHPALPKGEGVVTLSAGAASAILGEGLAATEIIAGADAALYAAKRNGRNQVWPPFPGTSRQEAVTLARRRAAG